MSASKAGVIRATGIGARFAERYRDVVASIYIYNEHRGYTALDPEGNVWSFGSYDPWVPIPEDAD